MTRTLRVWKALAERSSTGLVIVVVAALVIGILSPLRLFTTSSGGALHLPELASAGSALEWTADARSPATTQAEAVGGLLHLLGMLGWVGFAIGTLTILACYAAQAPERAAEIGVRRAVGASLRRLVTGALLDAAMLAAIALGCGVAIGSAVLAAGKAAWPGYADRFEQLGPGPAVAISAVLGAACLIPFWIARSRRLSQEQDAEVGLRIPTLQIAVSIALLMASAGLIGTAASPLDLERADQAKPGVIAQVDSGLADPAARRFRYAGLLMRASRERGALVSLTSPGAAFGLGTVTEMTTDCGSCMQGGIGIRWPHFQVVAYSVSPDSFRVLGIPVVEGRGFGLTDRDGEERVAVVNQVLARRYFQHGRAVGKLLYLGASGMDRPYRVIGVVENEEPWVLGGSRQPLERLYLSILQHPSREVEVVARSATGPGTARETIMRMLDELGPTATLRRITDESVAVAGQVAAIRWFGSAVRLMAGAILIIALAGVLFAVRRWAESVAWEVALRRSLGARRRRVAGSIILRIMGMSFGGGILGAFLYQQIGVAALAGSLPSQPRVSPAMLIAVAFPVLLAVVVGSISAFRILYRPPATILR